MVNLMAIGHPERFGTAKEDAMRRDFNINSMFYNINEAKVEDLTGKGISDLNNKVINTPEAAVKLLTQDACCVLRAIRFSNRFNF
jgi:tRNA nucleotidyltransferase (CCA-adding enzyme)